MNRYTTIALGAVALGLFVFITVYERHTLTSGELEERAGRLLERFVRNRVEGFEILDAEGVRVRGVREREDAEELGDWQMVAPIEWAADEDAVSMMLNALEYADARRTLEGVDATQRTQFGLESPQLIARFNVADEELEVRFGNEDPAGGGLYMSSNDPTQVWVVGRDVFEALDHQAGHFRSKRLLATGVNEATVLELTSSTIRIKLQQRDGQWRLQRDPGEELRASRGRVEEALQTISDLSAESFVEEAPESLASFGLAAPLMRIEARDGELTRVVRVGAPCENGEQVYVRVDEGPIVCVLKSVLAPFELPVDDWRERRPMTMNDLELDTLTMVAGDDRMELEEREGAWKLRLQQSGQQTEMDADDEALAQWLSSIRNASAQEIVPADDAVFRRHGLTRPAATLTLKSNAGREEVLHIGDATVEGVYVRRGEEGAVLVLAPDVASAFTLSAVRLRKRQVLELEHDTLTQLGITRGTQTERVAEVDDAWRVQEPINAAADRARVRSIARDLSVLQVERFVADAPSAEHGFRTPALVAAARFGEQNITLRVGAESSGGHFAQLNSDPAVFVVAQTLVERLSRPLVDYDVFGTDEINLAAITLQRGDETLGLERDAAGWKASDRPVPGEQIEPLLTALEQLRASGTTAYGPATAADGFEPPRLRILIRRADDAPEPRQYEVLVGAPATAAGRSHLRRADLAVGYTAVVPAALLDFWL